MKAPFEDLFGKGIKHSAGSEARKYNLLAARLITDLVRDLLGPGGLEKIFIDILGEVTLTKNGATLLRKIDVDHPAAKVLIEASNAVANEVGDGTTSVVVLAGALLEEAEKLIDNGIPPATIAAAYLLGLDFSLEALRSISELSNNSDKQVLNKIARTCMGTKSIFYTGTENNTNNFSNLVVEAIYTIADFNETNIVFDTDDIKIEEKIGNASDSRLIKGVVIDKSVDCSAMPKIVENAKILVINEDLDNMRSKMDAQINITSQDQIGRHQTWNSLNIKSKVKSIIDSGANLLISQKGINALAQSYLAEAGIISIRRVKENDIRWIEKATGAKATRELDELSDNDLGFAQKVYEQFIGDDKMVFIEGTKNPKSVTLLLRANSKRILDEYHRNVLDAIRLLKAFVMNPRIIGGGGSTEALLADKIRRKSSMISGREQIVLKQYAAAIEQIPMTIAKNSGMNVIDTITSLRANHSLSAENSNSKKTWYGIDAKDRQVMDIFKRDIVEPAVVKEQIIKTATEVATLLVRVDDVLMAKPAMYTHTHGDGMQHSHRGGDKKHDHYFDKLGKLQRPMHHYY